jgi:hypothetical protein
MVSEEPVPGSAASLLDEGAVSWAFTVPWNVAKVTTRDRMTVKNLTL